MQTDISQNIENNKAIKPFDYPISFLRLFATFCIIGLHSIQSIGGNPDYFPWFSGVPLFFIISGYLFGQGHITNVVTWYKKRLVRVWLPFVLLVIVNYIIITCYNRTVSLPTFLKTIFLFPAATSDYALGVGHCWYVSYIIIAYAITPLLHKLFDSRHRYFYVLLSFVATVAICQFTAYTPFFGKLSFAHFVLYITAFGIGKLLNQQGKVKASFAAIIIGVIIYTIAKCGMLLTANSALNSLLDLIAVNFISLSFFGLMVILGSKVQWNTIIHNGTQRVIKTLDHNSYYAYLVHVWFVQWGYWSVFDNTSVAVIYAEYIPLILLSTLLFSLIAERVIKEVNNSPLMKR